MMGKRVDYLPDKSQRGNIIIDLSVLNDIVKQLCCKKCNSTSVEIFELTELRKGLAFKLEMSCSTYGYRSNFNTSRPTNIDIEGRSRPMLADEVNVRLAYRMQTIGKGQTAAEAMCAVMKLPKPPKRFQIQNKPLAQTTRTTVNMEESTGKPDILAIVELLFDERTKKRSCKVLLCQRDKYITRIKLSVSY